MINEPGKIINLESLEREKERLKVYCSYSEQLMKDKFTFIKNNLPLIIAEEFLPFPKEKNTKISNVLDWVNEFVIGKFLKIDINGKNKILASLLKIAEVGVIRLITRFRKK